MANLFLNDKQSSKADTRKWVSARNQEGIIKLFFLARINAVPFSQRRSNAKTENGAAIFSGRSDGAEQSKWRMVGIRLQTVRVREKWFLRAHN